MIYRFGPYKIDTERLELTESRKTVAVQPQVFALLVFLIEHRDRVVSKDEIIDQVWGGRIISDGALNTRINAARRAVGDTGDAQSVIKTFPRRGFRFVGTLEDASSEDPGAANAAAPTPTSERTSIAVLPFANLSGDADQDYVTDGIAEDLITTLSHFRQFFVIARNSTAGFTESDLEPQEIAVRLGARFLLRGSFRKSGSRVRISAQLIDGQGGNTIWSERYDRELTDIFAIQDDIATTIVAALHPEVSRVEQDRARRKATENLGAWDLYYRGLWHCWRTERKHLEEAASLFRKSIERDPEFATPRAYLAFTLWRLVIFRYLPRESLQDAYDAATTARDLDEGDANAHWAMGVVHLQRREHELARKELDRAIALNPSFASAYQWLGWTLVYDGKPEDGIEDIHTAQRLSPNDPYSWGMTLIEAQARVNARQFEDAERLAREVRHRAKTVPVNCTLLAAVGHLGIDGGRAELIEEIRTVDSAFEPETIVEVFPLRRPEDIKIWTEGLRLAGL